MYSGGSNASPCLLLGSTNRVKSLLRETKPLRDRLQHAAMRVAAHCDDGCSVLHLNGYCSAMKSLYNCFFSVKTL